MASSLVDTGHGFTLGSFGRWWFRELKALVPSSVRHWLRLDRQTVIVCCGAGEQRAFRLAAGRLVDLGPLEQQGRLAAGLRRGRVVLRLKPELGLQKVVSLPLAAEENLREVLEFEMERQTPFRADQVHFACEVLERRLVDRQISVRLAVVPRDTVAAALGRLQALGLRPELVDLAPGEAPVDPRRNLLGPAGLGARRGRRTRALTVLAIALLAAAIGSPYLRNHLELSELRAAAAALRPAAERAMQLRQTLDASSEASALLLSARAGRPAAAEILEEVSRVLPDDTWLVQMQWSEGRLEIQGVAASAASLVPLIEQSPLFKDVGFRTPVVREPTSGRERFQFIIGLEARP